ncbi:MAG: hypothetical protein KGI54_15115 [Pseudomonadota bacterium]|nr:hypothetical protein [Pseudomonadota bacterium]
MQLIQEINTFGDARKLILQTMIQLRDGKIDISRGMAIAANMKVLNDSIQCEINAAKVSMIATEKGHDFGKIVRMGQTLIGRDE